MQRNTSVQHEHRSNKEAPRCRYIGPRRLTAVVSCCRKCHIRMTVGYARTHLLFSVYRGHNALQALDRCWHSSQCLRNPA
jgi:hypothetical protein